AELQAGQRLRVDAQGAGAPGRVAPGDVGAWRQGWLVFDRTPLPEVVARWNDHLAQPLVLADDPALQALRLTGSFPLREPSALRDSLPRVLPVRLERLAEGGYRIVARR
ncbi:MAG TPA: iron dicitrate transport regulator FecR, partial [Pseudorhodoferax sp.]|nr:iron dicitrate transport regulator FecR [Pseudorhodoferax sp.]